MLVVGRGASVAEALWLCDMAWLAPRCKPGGASAMLWPVKYSLGGGGRRWGAGATFALLAAMALTLTLTLTLTLVVALPVTTPAPQAHPASLEPPGDGTRGSRLGECGDVHPNPGPLHTAAVNITPLCLHAAEVASWEVEVIHVQHTKLSHGGQKAMHHFFTKWGWHCF